MFNDYPLISIGIPFYNAEKYLGFAIQSVIAQSYENWELILVDDGSSDNSLKIAQEFSQRDGRIRVIYDGQNKKLPSRLNQIIQESKGEFIARMDADDIMHPERLEKQFNFLEKNINFDLVSSGIISIDNFNNIIGYRCVESLYTDFSVMKRSHPIAHPTVFARKNWYLRNQYNINFPRSEDFELWCRASLKNDLKLAVIPDLLLYYREAGVLSIDKINRSYRDGLEIYKNYNTRPQLKVILKEYIKMFLVKTLDRFGFLQHIVKLRNKKNVNRSFIDLHKKILDNIMTGSVR